jgi:hypothetical protein
MCPLQGATSSRWTTPPACNRLVSPSVAVIENSPWTTVMNWTAGVGLVEPIRQVGRTPARPKSGEEGARRGPRAADEDWRGGRRKILLGEGDREVFEVGLPVRTAIEADIGEFRRVVLWARLGAGVFGPRGAHGAHDHGHDRSHNNRSARPVSHDFPSCSKQERQFNGSQQCPTPSIFSSPSP